MKADRSKRLVRPAAALLAALCLGAAPARPQDAPGGAADAERVARTVIDLMRRGGFLLRSGAPRRAAMEFEKALRLDPSNSAAAESLDRCAAAVSCAGEKGR